jgi:glutamate 5-kinase
VGTRFSPAARRDPAFKLWLRYAKPSLGTVSVDAGAATALRERGTSLLAVGVTGCQGTFVAGDAVDVVADSGPVGKGIASLSADEIRSVAGMKSEQVRAVLPDAAQEVIHRDGFVLADPPGPRGGAGARG